MHQIQKVCFDDLSNGQEGIVIILDENEPEGLIYSVGSHFTEFPDLQIAHTSEYPGKGVWGLSPHLGI